MQKMQLSMALLGIRSGHLVVYGAAKDEIKCYDIEFDAEFCRVNIQNQVNVYFHHFLPYLISKNFFECVIVK